MLTLQLPLAPADDDVNLMKDCLATAVRAMATPANPQTVNAAIAGPHSSKAP